MKRVSIKFRHNGKVVALRALTKFDGSGHLVLTKHGCNSRVSVEVIESYVFLLFFDRPGTYSYAACGHFDKYFLSLSYICPYNKKTGIYEREISAQWINKRENW